MMNNRLFFGGDFFYQEEIKKSFVRKEEKTKNRYFLSGGRSALHLISKYLKNQGIKNILLPSYLCPTILDELNEWNFKILFYSINDRFAFEKGELLKTVDTNTAVYFINYFGLSMDKETFRWIDRLTAEGVCTIYDGVQDIVEREVGTFAYNSTRKILPYSVSVLKTDRDLGKEYSELGCNIPYYEHIKLARTYKTNYVIQGRGNEELYLQQFRLSEEYYYSCHSIAEDSEVEAVKQTDYNYIVEKRKKNYDYLQEELMKCKDVKMIYTDLKERVPFCMPIYIDKRHRDSLRKNLSERKIFLPIHWDLRLEDRIIDVFSKELSSKILSVPVDQRYSIDECKNFLEIFRLVLKEIKSG